MSIENQAAWCNGPGQTFRVGVAPRYTPQADQVLIRNKAIAINPIDWKIQAAGFSIKTWPTIFGFDLAGEVVEIGGNVTRFQKGDRVIAYADSLWADESKYNAFQLYPVANTSLASKIPDHLAFQNACVLPTAIETAVTALFSADDATIANTRFSDGRSLQLPPPSMNPQPCGKTMVIWGGSSSVGSVATQLAVSAGVKVVSVASSHNHDLCRECGASLVVDYHSPTAVSDVVEAVKAIGGEFAGVLDAISMLDGSLQSTPKIVEQLGGGLLVTTRAVPENLPHGVEGFMIHGGDHLTDAIWKDFVPEALANNRLRCLPPAWVVGGGLEEIQQAVNESKRGVSGKKIVVTIA